MFELLLSLSNKVSHSGEQQIIPPSNTVGQPNTNVVNGFCQSIDNTAMYVVGGSVDNGVNTNALFKYDIASKTWARLSSVLASMNNVTYWSIVQLDSNTLYAMCRDIVAVYNLTTNVWTLRTALTGVGSDFYYPRAHLYNGAIYRVGQAQGGNDIVMRYDPTTGTHTQLSGPSFNSGTYAASAIVGSKIYVFPNGAGTSTGNVYSYNIATNQINTYGSFAGNTIRLAIPYGTDIYLLGYGSTLKVCYKFDTLTNTITRLKDLVRSGYMFEAYRTDGAINLYGGRSTNDSSAVWYKDTLAYSI